MRRTFLIGIAALLVLLCFGGVSAEEMAELAVCTQPSLPDVSDTKGVDITLGEVGTDAVATFVFGGIISESFPSDTTQFTVPPGVYNYIQVDMKFYQVDGEWSDLRLKLVDSNNRVLAQDEGPWIWIFGRIFENGERHVQYGQLQEGDVYRVVVEKISLAGDTKFDGTGEMQIWVPS